MAGHKWSKVQHIKGPLGVRRGAAFHKPVKEITVTARLDGGCPSGNPRWRAVATTACARSFPRGNAERTVAKAVNDNKNRSLADQRIIFSTNHGRVAAIGNVPSVFHREWTRTVPRSLSNEDQEREIAA